MSDNGQHEDRAHRGVSAKTMEIVVALLTLVLGFLLAPLFLIVPLMVSAVMAADAFAGEKERRTMETLLHLPIVVLSD